MKISIMRAKIRLIGRKVRCNNADCKNIFRVNSKNILKHKVDLYHPIESFGAQCPQCGKIVGDARLVFGPTKNGGWQGGVLNFSRD